MFRQSAARMFGSEGTWVSLVRVTLSDALWWVNFMILCSRGWWLAASLRSSRYGLVDGRLDLMDASDEGPEIGGATFVSSYFARICCCNSQLVCGDFSREEFITLNHLLLANGVGAHTGGCQSQGEAPPIPLPMVFWITLVY